MLVKIENPAMLTKAIEIISDLVTEVRIKFNEFGLSIVAMDPANVSMVGFKIPKSAFLEFEAGEETLGVNLEDFKKILKRAGKGVLTLEKKDELLNISIDDKIKRNFTLGLLNIDSEEKEYKKLEYSANVEIDSVDLIASIEDCSVVDDACGFSVEEGKFIIYAKGLNSARSEFSGDEAKIEAEDASSRYSLEYLVKFMKAAKICEKTKLRFGTNHPLEIEFATEGMNLRFILAPRTETED